jgi:hypothetical protein
MPFLFHSSEGIPSTVDRPERGGDSRAVRAEATYLSTGSLAGGRPNMQLVAGLHDDVARRQVPLPQDRAAIWELDPGKSPVRTPGTGLWLGGGIGVDGDDGAEVACLLGHIDT